KTLTVTPNAGFTGAITIKVGVTDPSHAQQSDEETFTLAAGDKPIKNITGTAVQMSAGVSGDAVQVATFTSQDPKAAATDFTVNRNWGGGAGRRSAPGASIVKNGDGTFVVKGTNAYKAEGSFVVTVTVTGKGGAKSIVTTTATVG